MPITPPSPVVVVQAPYLLSTTVPAAPPGVYMPGMPVVAPVRVAPGSAYAGPPRTTDAPVALPATPFMTVP